MYHYNRGTTVFSSHVFLQFKGPQSHRMSHNLLVYVFIIQLIVYL